MTASCLGGEARDRMGFRGRIPGRATKTKMTFMSAQVSPLKNSGDTHHNSQSSQGGPPEGPSGGWAL